MTSAQLVPALVVPFIAWRVYSRARRNIGRQHFHRGRMIARIAFFGVISAFVGFMAAAHLPALAAFAAGLLLAVPLAVVGLRLTKFETTDEGAFYTPNTAIGIGLTVLLVGRIGYRVFVLLVEPPVPGSPPPAVFQSPVTLLVFGVTAGYYIAYSAGVLLKARKTN